MDRTAPLILLIVAMIYLFACPYTKVEESFNIQAIHDICQYRNDIEKYDHTDFPGVVPRTFLGAVVVSSIYCPLANLFSIPPGLYHQLFARAVLGLLVFSGFCHYALAIRSIFGVTLFRFFCLISASQFHFNFYMTRTLPNTFAMALVLHMLPLWMELMWQKKSGSSEIRTLQAFIALAALAIMIFRFELVLLCGCLYLTFLSNRIARLLSEEEKSLKTVTSLLFRTITITVGFAAAFGLMAIGVSVIVDSLFWRKMLWPEGNVAWFNIVLNKSSQWGTRPFFWYFSSALPRMLLTSMVFVPVGFCVDGRMRQMCCAACGFIFLFSFLPHKELRFVLYCLPILNAVAASGYQWTIRMRSNRLRAVATACCVVSLLMNGLLCGFFAAASINNYPGGTALTGLQKFTPNSSAFVYVDNMAAQTGVTRFVEDNTIKKWRYDKTENKSDEELFSMNFDFLLLDADRLDKSESKKLWQQGYVTLKTFGSFGGFNKQFLFNRSNSLIIKNPAVTLLMRKLK